MRIKNKIIHQIKKTTAYRKSTNTKQYKSTNTTEKQRKYKTQQILQNKNKKQQPTTKCKFTLLKNTIIHMSHLYNKMQVYTISSCLFTTNTQLKKQRNTTTTTYTK